jgi:hypothetical protein
VKDPQFHRDVGFYVFKLPFLSFVVDWLFASLLIILIVVTVAHYLNGGIRVQPPSPRVAPQVKAHLSVLLALLAVVKAADYWLQRFELTVSSRGVVDGATYTDVKAQLPALNLLLLISLAAAVLFVANIFRRGWTLPVVAVGLWVFVAVTVGGIYPQYVQRFRVQPNESAKERPYIERNIEATRAALNLDNVQTERYTPTTNSAEVSLEGAAPTIRNIRLWDRPRGCRAPRSSNCSGSATTTASMTSTSTATRSTGSPPRSTSVRARSTPKASRGTRGSRTTWPTRTATAWRWPRPTPRRARARVPHRQRASRGRSPALERGIRLDDRAGIYFGEDLNGYVVVNTKRQEIDFQDARTPSSRPTTARTGSRPLGAAAGRLRPALRRPQPADLGLHDRRLEDHLSSAMSSTACGRWPRSCTPTPTPTRWRSRAGSSG